MVKMTNTMLYTFKTWRKAASSLGRPVPLLQEELPHPTPHRTAAAPQGLGCGDSCRENGCDTQERVPTAYLSGGVTRRKACPLSASQGAVLAGGLVCSVSTVLGEYRFTLLCIELKLYFSPWECFTLITREEKLYWGSNPTWITYSKSCVASGKSFDCSEPASLS